jgi:polyphosphate kinase
MTWVGWNRAAESGIILIKYWLEVRRNRPDDSKRASTMRERSGKLSPMDLKSCSRWYDYSRACGDMYKAADTSWVPWHVARSDDKKRAGLHDRASSVSDLLRKLHRDKPQLPER